MNFKLKALIAIAITSITISGTANALTNNEMFLVAYDATAQKTFIAALGQAGSVSAFAGKDYVSVNYSSDTNWQNLMSTATTGSVSYQVLGFYQSNPAASTSYNAGDKLLVSSNVTLGSFNNGRMNSLMADEATASGGIGMFEYLNSAITGISTGLVLGNGSDSGSYVSNNVFTKYLNVDTTATLGTDLGFYSLTRPTSTSNLVQMVKTQFMHENNIVDADTWNLSATGHLNYTAYILPEADTNAMMLMGLGLMGFLVRRRKNKQA